MRTRYLLIPALLASAAGVAVLASQDPGDAQPAPPPPPAVTVAEVTLRPVQDWDDFTGRFAAVETVEIRPRVSGYVESVRFEEGAAVAAGDLLFQIDGVRSKPKSRASRRNSRGRKPSSSSRVRTMPAAYAFMSSAQPRGAAREPRGRRVDAGRGARGS